MKYQNRGERNEAVMYGYNVAYDIDACGNGNDKNSQSNNKQQEQNSNNVKQLPLIKKFKEIISYNLTI